MTRPVNTPPKTTGREVGFTLIELIAVLTLIGILAVVVFPKFASTQAFQQRILSDQLTNMLLQSRAQALSRDKQPIALRVVTEEVWQLTILADSNGDGRYDLTLTEEKLDSPNTNISLIYNNDLLGNSEISSGSSESGEGFLLAFDQLGNVQAANQQAIRSNLLFRLNDKLLCVSPAAIAWQPKAEKECLNG